MRPYPRYRDSGVEWLGDVPAHWEVRRLKRSVLRSDVKIEHDDGNALPPYVGLEHVASWTGSLLPLDSQQRPEGVSNAFAGGDVLFGKLRPYLAKAFLAEFGGLCSTEFLVLRPLTYEQRYLLYVILTGGFVSLVDSSTYGAKMPRANWDFVGNIPLSLPPLDEQRAIAAFLDERTERIDALVARKRLLLERLAEYRNALITHAVTRGLDPSAPLKPSGVEWLGDVPVHWDVRRLKHSVLRSDIMAEANGGEGLPYVGLEHVASWTGSLLPLDGKQRPESVSNAFEAGDVLFGKLRPYLAKAFVAEFDGVCSTEFLVLKPLAYERRYLLFTMLTDGLVSLVDSSTYGAKMPRANWNFVANLSLPLPPLDEQRAIAAYLDERTARIDALASRIKAAILEEYRAALVTAAVTGRIDVRDATAPAGGAG